MNLAEKLQFLRNKNRLSQEELEERLGISRQAISKWESGQATPDLKNNNYSGFIYLYNVTIDNLVKDGDDFDILQNDEGYNKENRETEKIDNKNTQVISNVNRSSIEYEYKSKRTVFGLPLVHINVGRGLKKAKGVIAVGNISKGIISVGFISLGIFSFGFLSIGLISLALLSIGLLAIGTISAGIFTIGAISIGIFSIGAVAIGKYAAGGASIASNIAIGEYANGHIAIGNRVDGINTLPLDSSVEDVENLIKQVYPNLKDWTINIIDFFIKHITIGTKQ